jgi:hypothetical protein
MKTKIELEQNIQSITTTIRRDFPELIQYLEDMPIDNSLKEDITNKHLEEYYQSLLVLTTKYAKLNPIKSSSETEDEFSYPSSEDIYQNNKNETEINPENTSKKKTPNLGNSKNEKSFKEDMSGDDLDVPGSELDDQQESVGSEDEENNYYSLGGDNQNDLEEDKG